MKHNSFINTLFLAFALVGIMQFSLLSETLPNITGFKLKVKNKYETEKYICIKNNTIEKFTRKWAITSGSVLP